MSASYYEIDPDTVQSVGRQVFGLQPEADAVVNALLTGYSDAAGTVHHPRVEQALGAFRDTHQRGHRAVPQAASGLGLDTARGARVLVDGTNESTVVQTNSLTEQQDLLSNLRRPLTDEP